MSVLENYFKKIRDEGHRLTKHRIAIIEILENEHLTFKEIEQRLAKRGFKNIASIYNNLEFLVQEKIVIELYVDNKKYYDLAMDNPGHNKEDHIHIVNRDTGKIFEINNNDIFNYISKNKSLQEYNIESIKIILSVTNKK
jgi:Fur family transcriptional regulator, peroxide stress response regulator